MGSFLQNPWTWGTGRTRGRGSQVQASAQGLQESLPLGWTERRVWGTAVLDCPQERDTDASSHMRCQADAASPEKGNKRKTRGNQIEFVLQGTHISDITNIQIQVSSHLGLFLCILPHDGRFRVGTPMAHNGGAKHLGQTGSWHLVGITVGSNPVEEGRYGIQYYFGSDNSTGLLL